MHISEAKPTIKSHSLSGKKTMPNLAEDSVIDLNNISSHFFSDSEAYSQLKKKRTKPYRYLYNLITPHNKRKTFEKEADIKQQSQVATCWKSFIELYDDNKLEKFSLKPKKELLDEKIVWQYWGQGVSQEQLPEPVKLYFRSVDKFCGNYKIIRLDDSNIQEYLNLPEFVWYKKRSFGFKPAFFADLLRLALLDVYGGIWLDATIYLTAPLPAVLEKDDFFMYQRSDNADNKQQWYTFNPYYFSWNNNHKVNLLNSVIFARKNSPVIHTCLDLILNFWKTQEYIPHYFFFQIMFDTLIKGKLTQYQCAIVDDTLPHLLVSVLEQPYDEANYKRIISKASIHKMSYIKDSKSGSYYDYILNNT